jgi:hypothetical protein
VDLGLVVPAVIVVAIAAGIGAVVAEAGRAGSRTRITAKQRGSRESPAGKAERDVRAASRAVGVPFRIQGDSMTTTFQKRQKEMKRMEKARAKAERRAQKKLDPQSGQEEEFELLTGPPPLEDDPLADPSTSATHEN